MTETMQAVDTVAFTMNVSGGGGASSISGDSVMDRSNRQARMNTTVSGLQGEQSVTQYIVDDTLYMNASGQWVRMNMSALDPWGSGNEVTLQRQLLENSSVEVTGSDTVDGAGVWVVSIEPDPSQLQSLASQQTSVGGVAENVEIQDVNATQYVDAETYHVRRVEIDMETRVQGQTSSTSMTMEFSAFDEPVSIDLPAAARNATELGGLGGPTGAAG